MTEERRTILKPSFLVTYQIASLGGKKLSHNNLTEQMEGETEIAQWESTKLIYNKEAYDEANALRAYLNFTLRGRNREQTADEDYPGPICFDTVLGLLCPFDNEQRLNDAARIVQEQVKNYNNKWRETRGAPTMKFFLMKANFLCTAIDTEAVIIKNITEMLERSEESIRNGNTDEAQQYLSQLRGLQNLFGDEMMERFITAIKEGKKNKNKIAKAVKAETDINTTLETIEFNSMRAMKEELVTLYPETEEGETANASFFYTADIRKVYEPTISLDKETKTN